MSTFFVPYFDNKPVCLDVKGHRLVIVTAEREPLLEELGDLGGDDVRELNVQDDLLRRKDMDWLAQAPFVELAQKVEGGVVFAPPGISPTAIIETLERELPWLH
jgi:hypothetical protein